MQTYDFRLVLPASEIDEAQADALYAQCKDATLLTVAGANYLEFGRRAASLESAIRSAIADVNKAGYEVAKVEIEREDLQNLLDAPAEQNA